MSPGAPEGAGQAASVRETLSISSSVLPWTYLCQVFVATVPPEPLLSGSPKASVSLNPRPFLGPPLTDLPSHSDGALFLGTQLLALFPPPGCLCPYSPLTPRAGDLMGFSLPSTPTSSGITDPNTIYAATTSSPDLSPDPSAWWTPPPSRPIGI